MRLLALAAGYWDNTKQQQTVTAAALDAFLQARSKESIDFTVGVCAHPYDTLKIPATQYDAVATNLMRFLGQDNTLRTNDGRKILNICDARGLGDGSNAQVKQFVDAVRAKARSQLGEDIYVMINQAGFDPEAGRQRRGGRAVLHDRRSGRREPLVRDVPAGSASVLQPGARCVRPLCPAVSLIRKAFPRADDIGWGTCHEPCALVNGPSSTSSTSPRASVVWCTAHPLCSSKRPTGCRTGS
ncbi:hypothetical protein ACIBG5_29060 [Kribbella sp. NPDC050241]|uniref:hypothetical protein n=1 Tax=Kribbella sp. NPDC050241 TaxID=3364115 RepID=UPI0037B4E75A